MICKGDVLTANRGKQFESKLKEDFLKIEGSTINRIYDTTNGFRGVKNVCDFIGYIFPNIYYLEAKSHEGNTFPLKNFTQYDALLEKIDVNGAIAGVVLWMIDHDKVVFIPIQTFKEMFENGEKSFNIKMLNNSKYKFIEIPSKKKRTFLDSDYSILKEEYNGKDL